MLYNDIVYTGAYTGFLPLCPTVACQINKNKARKHKVTQQHHGFLLVELDFNVTHLRLISLSVFLKS